MKKSILIVILLVAVALVIGIVKFNIFGDNDSTTQKDENTMNNENVDQYVFTTKDGKTGVLTYTTENKSTATLSVEGKFYQLNVAVSGSGARYINEDESVVFWEHQGEATIEIDGKIKYEIPKLTKADLLTFNVEPQKKDCVGVSKMKCFVVDGELFYDSIEGFDFKEGNEYKIIVARTEKENVPQDASKYSYQLVEVLKSHKQEVSDSEVKEDDSKDSQSTDPLTLNSWEWKETQYSDDKIVKPSENGKFVAKFEDGKFSSSTDCNNVFGSYTLDEEKISFGALASTKMACQDEAKEVEYSKMLGEVTSYMISDSGNLVLMLKYDSGSMIFTKR